MSAHAEQFRQAAASATVKEAAPSRSFKPVLVVGIVLVVLAVAAYFFLFAKPGPAQVGKDYLEALQSADTALQDQFVTWTALQRKSSNVAIIKALSAKGIRPSAVSTADAAEIEGDSRTLRATLTYPPPPAAAIADLPVPLRERLRKGGMVPVILTLVREKGEWKVDDLRLAVARMPTGGLTPPPTAPASPGSSETPAGGGDSSGRP